MYIYAKTDCIDWLIDGFKPSKPKRNKKQINNNSKNNNKNANGNANGCCPVSPACACIRFIRPPTPRHTKTSTRPITPVHYIRTIPQFPRNKQKKSRFYEFCNPFVKMCHGSLSLISGCRWYPAVVDILSLISGRRWYPDGETDTDSIVWCYKLQFVFVQHGWVYGWMDVYVCVYNKYVYIKMYNYIYILIYKYI